MCRKYINNTCINDFSCEITKKNSHAMHMPGTETVTSGFVVKDPNHASQPCARIFLKSDIWLSLQAQFF